MLRFSLPEDIKDFEKQCKCLREQVEGFFRSDALRELFSVLETDEETIEARYDVRKRPDGRVVEIPELERMESLEPVRKKLYDVFRELGFIDINKPALSDWNRVVILGGVQNSIYTRVKGAIRFINPSVISVDGIACYRPISPLEKKRSPFKAVSETEFGVMNEVFHAELPVTFSGYTDRFTGDRNLNSVSNVRILHAADEPREYRIYAAPSSEPAIRRADTGDSVWFYLDNDGVNPDDHLLFITRNHNCNRQFLHILYYMIKRNHITSFDVIGCLSDEELEKQDKYEIIIYIQEVIALLSWARTMERSL
ncbi:MAG: hypothetical protein IKQ97_10855 [Eubacterium sp.]|nr:hypothetical protein [Eubacterium sp.]